ncbi:hypothetical protein WICMUC_001547 [Wickerhamomyces mucosus]|uniref:Palmitoyl-protein thioesterase 1 n=1 Tax=Wickerhamomyces mucosus TaxID=1378264 RepID=A0A9P8TH75_9ASCO|nr:hypothetical protein WICMUC_001547 [Wickerhamomyces mucosus]
MHVGKFVLNLLSTFNVLKKIAVVPDERPVVFWHGMGDSYNSSAMQRVFDMVYELKPNIFIHSIYLDGNNLNDQKKSLIGDVNQQIDLVCNQLTNITELENGFDMIGFSQGGLFARAAIEKCGLKVHNLITFGSPHSGVYDLPKCSQNDWACENRNKFLKKQVWNERVQGSIISAQYFRDPLDYDNYLEHSKFLSHINNEVERNYTYSENLSRIEKLILIQFDKDETLIPKDSAWFYDSDKISRLSIPFNESRFYENDCVGLKKLYDENRIEYLNIDEGHMRINDEFFKNIINNYVGQNFK